MNAPQIDAAELLGLKKRNQGPLQITDPWLVSQVAEGNAYRAATDLYISALNAEALDKEGFPFYARQALEQLDQFREAAGEWSESKKVVAE